mgnify:CR=1 FL=1
MKKLFPFFAIALLAGCKTAGTTDNYGYDSSSDTTVTSSAPSDAMSNPFTATHTVVLKTSQGNITVELDANTAPRTVANFVTHAEQGYYDNLTFHRVIPGFMIQGGDPSGNGTGGKSIYGDEFEDEIEATSKVYQYGYKKGVMAMANRGPNTNGSQFFIMEADYPLPPSYTIFGHVVKGQDVVTKIANVPRGESDRPTTPVTFTPEVTKP